MALKLLVRYSDLDPRLARGDSARLIPVDHPDSSLNGQWVATSPVLQFQPGIGGPVIETLYTVYIAAETDETFPHVTNAKRKSK